MANLHKIFLNLPVQDLPRSMDFFRALGYTFNMQFTDEKAACLVLSDDIFVMLLIKTFFQGFITGVHVQLEFSESRWPPLGSILYGSTTLAVNVWRKRHVGTSWDCEGDLHQVKRRN